MLSSTLPKFSITPPPPRITTFRPPFISNSTTTTYKQRSSNLYINPQRMTSSLYEVLGIPIGASNQEIKSAYRRLARTCHPDVATLDRKDTSADEFMKIHAAYSTLSDPQKRAVYDLKLVTKNRPLTVSYSGGYRGRSWETDQCW
ncbi:chaperone protein dnaJ 11, chloroplastic [Ricinus communis]|uniref:Chaperone protein dnaJ 11, chloroplast, putative n=1 Tax=Ricinus communis TaxID=3988 RepID=B9S6N6_RICCO|nr:chaperone protein dnaJ 11, chloroplastic [Ricinus communis]EEF40642.1 Chaperone protein dnaJ 11, chloroplast precursor, putative [Ricinus communis]|eukprot:XP_002521655.1 chaperone protein dnaJ 11, chloroplastic [Ricinus communis]